MYKQEASVRPRHTGEQAVRTSSPFRRMSVLIPDAGGDLETVKVLRCLGWARGARAHVLSTLPLPPARFSRYCARVHPHSSRNDDEWVAVIEKVVEWHKIDVVLPVTLRGVQFVARKREALSHAASIPPFRTFR